MGEIIDFETVLKDFYDFTATCECGNNKFYIMVDGLGHQWEKIIGTRCTRCDQIIQWKEQKS